MKPFKRLKTDGSGALKDAAVTALETVTAKKSDSILPEMEVARISLMHYIQTYPTQEQLVAITEYLEIAYELKCQYVTVDLSSGSSWTDPGALWTVTVTLQGKKSS